VLGHIDFFQNNILYQKTWNDDFVGMALADKRLIAQLRTEHGRWVDYVIEFGRSIDNLCGYFSGLMTYKYQDSKEPEPILDYYFDVFLQEILKVPEHVVFNEIQRFNKLLEKDASVAENLFFAEIKMKHPEFQTFFQKYQDTGKSEKLDTMRYILEHSEFLKKEENRWMQSVLTIVRNTALYFEPQMRTKIINEGWASYWHDELFRKDERISGHESAFAKINAYVTSINRIGLNPYAIGLRLIQHVEDNADKGLMNFHSQKIENSQERENINLKTGKGREAIFDLRKNFSDFMLINTFTDQDFTDKHQLFTVGKRLNPQKRVIEYFIKSKKAEDYKKMLIDSLYHPPRIEVMEEKTTADNLYLQHFFEGKPLYRPYIAETLIGIEFLWGGQVQLETTEVHRPKPNRSGEEKDLEYRKVIYTVKNRKVEKKEI
jgi:stage V sporulation protein R